LTTGAAQGSTYGTIVVDLERRTVADVLATRSAKETADWLERRPEIEIVSRDRSGLYARGIRQGAPQARQVADRFHLLQNLRESIERQMTAISCFGDRSRLPPAPGDRQSVLRGRSRDARELMFEQAKDLHASGKSFVAIAAEIGVGHRTIAKWIEANALPHRRRLTLKPSSPLYFQDFLARRWAEGDKVGRRLFHDIRHRGYTGSRSHLERLLSEWRRVERPATSRPRESTREDRAIDPRRAGKSPRSSGRSLHEADADAHPFSGRQGRCVERSLSELCRDAQTGNAIFAAFYEVPTRQARLLAR